ncbi:MAG: tetratricopeptide repeat-containing protein [Candidatus Woesearchaeota archaeon]|nr:MAG: tetratricopeptide repeat-containing protein [Candidatus Woesearchaeota archaeon]
MSEKRVVALVLILLMISLPIAYAQQTSFEERAPERTVFNPPGGSGLGRDFGEDIIVEVDSYEPNVLISALLEENEIPVYANLKGVRANPFIDVPKIRNIRVRTLDVNRSLVRGVNWVRPGQTEVIEGQRTKPTTSYATLDDMGYLVILLNRIPKEQSIPDTIDIDLEATINFELSSGFGINEQDFSLQRVDEDAWLKDVAEQNRGKFLGAEGVLKNGYLRVEEIKDDSVTIIIYDSDLKPRGGRITLKPGEISDVRRLYGFSSNFQDDFRIKLNEITSPRDKIKVKLNLDGKVVDKILAKGQLIFDGSTWKIKDFGQRADGTFLVVESREPETTDRITREFVLKGTLTSKKVADTQSKLEIDLPPADFYTEDRLLSEVLESEVGLFSDLGIKVVYGGSAKERILEGVPLVSKEVVLSGTNLGYQLTGNTRREAFEKLINDLGFSFVYLDEQYDGDVLIYDPENFDLNKHLQSIKIPGAKINEGVFTNLKGPFVIAEKFRLEDNLEGAIAEYEKAEKRDPNGANYSVNRLKSLIELKKVIDVFGGVSFPEEISGKQINVVTQGNYGGESKNTDNQTIESEALTQIAEIYESFGNPQDYQKAVLYYQQLLSKFKDGQRRLSQREIESKISLAQQRTEFSIEGDTRFFDLGKSVEILNFELALVKELDTSEAEFSIEDLNGRSIRKVIKISQIVFDESKDYAWRLDKVEDKSISLKRSCLPEERCRDGTKSVQLLLDRTANLEVNKDESGRIIFRKIQLVSTKSNKEASLTVLPGSNIGFAKTNFSIHIPVEKRAIQFSDDTIDDLIAKTQEQIDKLNDIITTLSDIVEKWKLICLATFAFVTVKNLFSSKERNVARQKAINDNWRDFCLDEVRQRREAARSSFEVYTYDKCISDHSKEIEKDISVYQKKIKEVNSVMKNNLENPYFALEGTEVKYENLEEYKQHPEINEDLLSTDQIRDLNLYYRLKDDQSISPEARKKATERYDALSKTINEEDARAEKVISEYDTWLKANPSPSQNPTYWLKERANYGNMNYDRAKQYILQELNYKHSSDEIKKESVFTQPAAQKFFTENELERVNAVPVGEANKPFYLTEQRGVLTATAVQAVTIGYLKNEKKLSVSGNDNEVVTDNLGRTVYTYKDQTGKENYIVSESEIDARGIRNDYVDPRVYSNSDCNAAEFFPTGKNGNYVQVEYDRYCRPVKKSLWNVGTDGRIATSDDIKLVDDSDWNKPSNEFRRDVLDSNRLIDKINNQFQRNNGATSVEYGGQIYSTGNSPTEEAKKTHCSDFMDPGDCKLLFLACDAVLCPPSRCNLGGRWNVASVPQSGLIGSIALCWPTTETKVCLTGILAGLQNIRSVLQGFNQCLKTQKISGESVGICDKIRSVWICELLWREVVSVFNLKGGLLSFIGEKVFGELGEGGGEYGSFTDNWKNAVESTKFFVNEYGKSAFTSYQGLSLNEVGTQICRSAIFGKLPGPGILDQITQPESPPQFTAEFDVFPYSERSAQSRYSIFYHIYAGENPGLRNTNILRYNVFLRNPNLPQLGILPATRPGCRGGVATIPTGGFASQNIDCVADSGFTEVCVQIEGRTECGFGKVSTNFALNYANDLYVADQAKKGIESEQECVSGTSGLDLFGRPTGVGQATITGIGALQTGIVRKCSVERPGTGTSEEQHWDRVGTCGKDSIGRDLGVCWIDTRTINLRDAKLRDEVLGNEFEAGVLAEQTREDLIEKGEKLTDEQIEILFGYGGEDVTSANGKFDAGLSALDALRKENSEFNEEEIKQKTDEAVQAFTGAINDYGFIIETAVNTEFAGFAQLRIGLSYKNIGEVYNTLKEIEESKKKVVAIEESVPTETGEEAVVSSPKAEDTEAIEAPTEVQKVSSTSGKTLFNSNPLDKPISGGREQSVLLESGGKFVLVKDAKAILEEGKETEWTRLIVVIKNTDDVYFDTGGDQITEFKLEKEKGVLKIKFSDNDFFRDESGWYIFDSWNNG